MKRFIYILAFALSSIFSFAQNVQHAEYYIDTDPGVGLATPMVAYDGNFNDALEKAIASNVSGLTLGFHTIGIRVKDNTNHWGPVFRTVINVQTPYVMPTINIATGEIFWDTDPGVGNGTAMLAFDGNFNNAFETVTRSTAAPSLGMHVLHVRVRDANSNWGPVFKTIVDVQSPYVIPTMNVSAAECFWDSDPGAGNGTPMLAFDGNFNSAMETLLRSSFGTPGLGIHVLNVRMKDAANNWGPVFRTIVDIQTPYVMPNIKVTAAELFWDTDPGQGNATPMLAFDGNYNQAYEAVIKSEQAFFLSQGLHVLNVRAVGANGIWSPVFRTVVYLDSCITNPTVTATAQGPTTFCIGDSVQLQASGSFANYYWRRNGNAIGNNSNFLWVTQSGNYVVTALDGNGCPATSQIISVTVNNPQAVITPASPITLCAGDSVLLDAGAGFSTYQWSNGATTQTIWLYTSDTMSVIVQDAAGCLDTSAQVISVVNPVPAVPLITQNGDTLVSTTAVSYQWYLNGNIIPGATGQWYLPNQSGMYTVVISDANGCSNTSSPYAYIHMNLGTSIGGALFSLVYPNPIGEDGTLLIHAQNFTGVAFVSIFDLTGRMIRTSDVDVKDGEGKLVLNNNEFAGGMYVYTIDLQNGETLNGKFSVQ